MIASLIAFLVSHKRATIAGAALLALSGAYLTGRDHAADACKARQAKADQRAIERQAIADQAAYERGFADAKKNEEGNEIASGIEREAAKRPDAGAVCVDRDTLDRLHDIP